MKYWTVFKISWSNGFVYRLNFLLWRLRNIILIVSIYYLWETIFKNNVSIFGYTREKILTYVFLTLILRAFILGVRSIDVGGEISDGRLANYLLRPINYLWYWFTRDWADKILNLIFSIFEAALLVMLFKPVFYFQTDPVIVVFTLAAVLVGILINFLLGSITSYTTFWTPGNSWGFWFVYFVIQDVLGGIMFPLNILSKPFYDLLMLTPFPYLMYFPANAYLGYFSTNELIFRLIVGGFWTILLFGMVKKMWRKGVRLFLAEGR
jgi:ABC-2 type transport system permease protein